MNLLMSSAACKGVKNRPVTKVRGVISHSDLARPMKYIPMKLNKESALASALRASVV